MKTILKIILLLPWLVFSACEKNDDMNIYNSEGLEGYWDYHGGSADAVTFKRTVKLNDNGMEFKPGGVLIQRKNSGWCGTPPITYANFEGTWKQKDSILYITAGYWGGTQDLIWRIVTLDSVTLEFKWIEE